MPQENKKAPDGQKLLDCAPKWVDVLPLYLQALAESKNPKSLDAAHRELRRMASLADQLNEIVKRDTPDALEMLEQMNNSLQMVWDCWTNGAPLDITTRMVTHSIHSYAEWKKLTA